MGIDIAILISTFERPHHLQRCLLSLERQRGVDGRFEVVVTDDGSRDGTHRLIVDTARRVPFPLTFTTHDHHGFRLARCRNEGAAASTADYLLFTDGDCILPPDHVRIHLDERRPGRVNASDCLRLDREASLAADDAAIHGWTIDGLVSGGERRRMFWKAVRAAGYSWMRAPMRPRLSGNNIAMWRSDFERVNGFDEQFVGWGLEDRDLQRRLAAVGVCTRSILHRTAPVHLWHEPAASFSRNNEGTENLRYYSRAAVPSFCSHGLVKTGDAPGPVTLPIPTRWVLPAQRRQRRAA
jgi:glycosyltransferase involved in cell wall biosynthesis